MTNAYATTTPAEDAAMRHAVTFANVFTQAALDAAHHGIEPALVRVDDFAAPSMVSVDVQVRECDVAAVDTLAELYGLAPDDPAAHNLLYMRIGHTLIAADTVAVRVYCRRPAQVVA